MMAFKKMQLLSGAYKLCKKYLNKILLKAAMANSFFSHLDLFVKSVPAKILNFENPL
jgi:hypothetical protein